MKLLIKARPYPDGAIRAHGGKKVRKQDGGWIPIKEGMSVSERAEAEEKNKKNKKNNEKIRKIEGTRPIYEILHNIATSKEPIYFDDVMRGKDKSIYNSLTKDTLITWEHVANDEYQVSLTEAGKNAYKAGHAYFSKVKREEDAKPKKVEEETFDDFEELIKIAEEIKKGIGTTDAIKNGEK